MMTGRSARLAWILLFLVASCGALLAQDPGENPAAPDQAEIPGPQAAPGKDQAKLMAKLADSEFKVRKEAQDSLQEWGEKNLREAIELFYPSYLGAEDPEVRALSRELLKEMVTLKMAGMGAGYLGITMDRIELVLPGAEARIAFRVTEVMEGTPAEKAGVLAGDLVFGIDEQKLDPNQFSDDFRKYVQSRKPRTDVTLHLQRQGKEVDVEVNLMQLPPEVVQRNLLQRNLLWQRGNSSYRAPTQAEAEEESFREWLQERRAEEAADS